MTDVRNDRDIDRVARAHAIHGADEDSTPPPAASAPKKAKNVAWDVGEKLLEEISYASSASALAQGLHAADNLRTAASGGGDSQHLEEVHGVRFFPLVEKQLPAAHDRVSSERAGNFQLRPQVTTDANGNDCVAYYIAVRHGHAEFAIGRDALDTFKQHHEMYEQQATHASGVATARPFEKDVYQTAELLRQDQYLEAAKQNVRAWDHAYRDPLWALQQAVNVGAAMAPTAGAAHATSDGIANESGAPRTSAGASIQRRQYQPTTTTDPSMPKGTGGTDKYGNVKYSTAGTPTDVALVEAHESVHSFLSPKALNGLRELRADVRMTAYQKSALCQYLEEALAEGYAQAKVKGFSSIPEGVAFPISEGYVTLGRVVTEAAIGTVVYGGVLYGVYVAVDK